MLSWRSGDGQTHIDPDARVRNADSHMHNTEEPPETPAYIFAARAFKHAIFGTPAPPPTQKQPRERPKSWNGGHRRTKAAEDIEADISGDSQAVRRRPSSSDGPARSATLEQSPAKRPGILLTPGTGGTRRKTVSFDGKNAIAGPDFEKASGRRVESRDSISDAQGPAHAAGKNTFQPRRRDPSSFAQKLRATASSSEPTEQDHADITLDMGHPRSTSGRYWKTEFDSHATKTATEFRKLSKKEEVAKKYAKHRDSAAAELEDELHNEQQKAAKLEAQVQDFRDRLAKAAKDSASSRESKKHELQAEIHAAVQTKDEAIRRLEAENKSLRAQLDLLRKQTTASAPIVPQKQPSAAEQPSDIWADAGDGQLLTMTPRRRLTSSRPPLQERDDNVVIDESGKSKQGKRESQLSTERREAAMRRLEERKRARMQQALAM